MKYKINKITTDLYLNPLSKYKESQKISLLIDGIVYNFTLNDLKKIWVKKLKSSENLFISPTNLINPYTNVLIKTHNLYNIYFKLYFTNQTVPTIIYLLFKCDMNVAKLSILHYPILKGYAIEHFIIHGNVYDLYDETINMLTEYLDDDKRIYLSTHTPNSVRIKIVNTLRKYLMLYLFARYSSNSLVKSSSDGKLSTHLNQYVSDNPYLNLNNNERLLI